MKKGLSFLLPVLLGFTLGALAFRGTLDPLIQQLGSSALREQNETYLTDTFEKALVGFGVMSGLKAGLAVIEGSTGGVSAGISLHLQVGDVVQSAYDYVDIAWRTLLAGCISLLCMQYLLQAAALVDAYVLGVCLILLGFLWGLRGFRQSITGFHQVLRDGCMLSVFAVLVVYLLLPVSIWSAARLSEHITRGSILSAQKGFAETSARLFPESEEQGEGLMARVKQIPDRIEFIAHQLKQRGSDMALWTIQLIAGYLFDCILFPLGMFVILLQGTRSLMRYCYHCGLQSTLRRELRRRPERVMLNMEGAHPAPESLS
ncbi:MAG: hypothetical protein WD708_04370 [Kiritimatiellia bacterium]